MSTINLDKKENTQFSNLIQRLTSLPLWVKQAVYCEIKADLAECSDIDLLDSIETKIIQLFRPKLTGNAVKLVSNNSSLTNIDKLDVNHKAFIKSAYNNLNLLEISQVNNWSFKQSCNILLDLIDESFVDKIDDNKTYNFILFITNRIRLGEFLVRTNRLTTDRLDKALYTKKCADELNTGLSFKDVLVNLNYLSLKEVNNISSIKESAEISISVIDQHEALVQENMILQDEVDALLFEKKKLEDQLSFYKKELEEKNLEVLECSKQVEKYTKGFVGKLITSLT